MVISQLAELSACFLRTRRSRTGGEGANIPRIFGATSDLNGVVVSNADC
jgi:hypothetical protein